LRFFKPFPFFDAPLRRLSPPGASTLRRLPLSPSRRLTVSPRPALPPSPPLRPSRALRLPQRLTPLRPGAPTDDQEDKTTAEAIIKTFYHMGVPQIFQGDKKITDTFKKHLKFLYPNVSFFTTKPHETNKNAIVERVIRTLKNDILRYLYFREFPEIREKLVGKEYVYEDTTSEVLQEICNMRNNTIHRTIREKPIDVFFGRAPNRQIIAKKKYPQFDKGDLVLIKPIRIHGGIKKKIFGFNYDIYIIVEKDGDKYQVRSLYNFIHNIILPKKLKEYEEQREIEKHWFKPYEIRKLSIQEALAHLNSPLTKAYVYRIHEDPEAVNDMRKFIQQL
jgi:hypothetical protein